MTQLTLNQNITLNQNRPERKGVVRFDEDAWGEKHSAIDPVLIGLEHLRSLKWACWSERLTDAQVEDVFWNNAARLLGVD